MSLIPKAVLVQDRRAAGVRASDHEAGRESGDTGLEQWMVESREVAALRFLQRLLRRQRPGGLKS